jgi:hypothetical protein
MLFFKSIKNTQLFPKTCHTLFTQIQCHKKILSTKDTFFKRIKTEKTTQKVRNVRNIPQIEGFLYKCSHTKNVPDMQINDFLFHFICSTVNNREYDNVHLEGLVLLL